MRSTFFYSALLLLLAFTNCKKEQTFPWRDHFAYSHEFTGDSCRNWNIVYMTTYFFKNWVPDTSIQRWNFSGDYKIRFCKQDSTITVSDSIGYLTHLPTVSKWKKIGTSEPFQYFWAGGQLWDVSRYYPKDLDGSNTECIILHAWDFIGEYQ